MQDGGTFEWLAMQSRCSLQVASMWTPSDIIESNAALHGSFMLQGEGAAQSLQAVRKRVEREKRTHDGLGLAMAGSNLRRQRIAELALKGCAHKTGTRSLKHGHIDLTNEIHRQVQSFDRSSQCIPPVNRCVQIQRAGVRPGREHSIQIMQIVQ